MGEKSSYTRAADAQRSREGGTSHVAAEAGADERAAAAKDREKVTGFSAGKAGADTGAGGEPMPKQADYGTMGAWQAAMRTWREKRGRAAAVKNRLGASSASQ